MVWCLQLTVCLCWKLLFCFQFLFWLFCTKHPGIGVCRYSESIAICTSFSLRLLLFACVGFVNGLFFWLSLLGGFCLIPLYFFIFFFCCCCSYKSPLLVFIISLSLGWQKSFLSVLMLMGSTMLADVTLKIPCTFTTISSSFCTSAGFFAQDVRFSPFFLEVALPDGWLSCRSKHPQARALSCSSSV